MKGIKQFHLSVVRLLTACILIAVILPLTGCQPKPALEGSGLEASNQQDLNPLKIIVIQDGMVLVSYDDLREFGWSEGDLEIASLYKDGQAYPFWLNQKGGQQGFIFYGQANRSRFTKENVYWLFPADTIIDPVNVTATIAPPADHNSVNLQLVNSIPTGAVLSKLTLEENLLYSPLIQGVEPWMWISLPAPGVWQLPIVLPDAVEGAAFLQMQMWGSTESTQDPDHHVRVRLNNQLLADEKWDGKGIHQFDIQLEPGQLIAGDNVLEIESPGDTGAPAEIAFLDWIELEYPQQPVAVDDRLQFVAAGGEVHPAGFSGPVDVYQLGGKEGSSQTARALDEGQGFDTESGETYLAVGPEGYLEPVRIERAELSPDLRDPKSNADYLAIGPEDLLEPLTPLLDLRTSQGLKTSAVSLQTIYDQFNAGAAEPDAVSDFLTYAHQNWDIPPRYILLVGDATYDPREYLGVPAGNRLPTFLVQTQFGGETGSDLGFGLVAAQPWQSSLQAPLDDLVMAVGRLPARTPDQVRAFVQKVLYYEQGDETKSAENSPASTVLAIADGQDVAFQGDAQTFINLFPVDMPTKLLSPGAGELGADQEIIAALQKDNWLVAYFGHGSINTWGKDQLFTADQVSQLDGLNKLPVVINMTCLTGLFTHPEVESLAETLMWQDPGGAVAVLAPTSLTIPRDQSYLLHGLIEAMLNQPEGRLGDYLLQARQQAPLDTIGQADVLKTFLLFGDPALVISR